MNAESMGLSSSRRQRRAQRGFVDNVLPTPENAPSARRSFGQGGLDFSHGTRRRTVLRRILVAAVCLAAVVCIAGGVGACTFFGSVDSKLSLGDSNASSALVAPAEGEAYYTLVAADLDVAGASGAQDGPDALALVRTDAQTRQVIVVSIPADVRVSLSDGKAHQLRDAVALGGDAALISAVASFSGVDVAHYVKADAAGIASLVDSLGGVEVGIAEEVDDPAAGDVYIPAGTSTLDGAAALTLLRASNFEDASERQAENQRALLAALSVRLIEEGGLSFFSMLDQVGGTFATDVDARSALDVADAMRGVAAGEVLGGTVPGYTMEIDGEEFYIASSSSWTSMMERVEAGEDPVVEEEVALVDPGGFTVTVRNGGGITGAASQMAESLSAQGFDVAETGNTDTTVYTETLVIYNDDAYEAAAQTVQQALGVGRTVPGQGYYTFDTNVLVILGKDWKPAA